MGEIGREMVSWATTARNNSAGGGGGGGQPGL